MGIDRIDNDISIKWKKVDSENPFPARDGHCSCGVDNKLYVFGGVIHLPNGDFQESNDLLCLDTETYIWNTVTATGDVPAVRSAATMSAVGKKLYVIGGLSQEAGWFDDLHVFDTETKIWKQLEPQGSGPSARDKLSSSVIGTKVYIFGGFGPQLPEEELEEDTEDSDYEDLPEDQEAAQFGWFNDIYVYDTETNTWSNPMQMNFATCTPRAATAMCSLGNNLYIFGGRDSQGRKNDLHIFNTETRKWATLLQISGCPPEPRSFHTATAIGSRLIILGGRGTSEQHFKDIHILDSETLHWLQPNLEGKVPPSRGVHTATVVGDSLVVFGGSGNFQAEVQQCIEFYNDVYTAKTVDITNGGSIPAASKENQENLSSPSKKGLIKPAATTLPLGASNH